VADAACTFVMFRAVGGGGGGALPVVLALLTKPEQPLNTIGATATTRSSTLCCNTLLILQDSSAGFPESSWPRLIETPLEVRREEKYGANAHTNTFHSHYFVWV